MVDLVLAEQQRLFSRRMTRFFPLILAMLMLVGGVLAVVIITANDASVDFVRDLMGANPDFPDDLDTGDSGTAILGPLGFLIPIMAFVIAASYYGADEKAGMIEHLLTWEPRRWRLLLARTIAGVSGIFVIATVLSSFFVAVLWVLSAVAGTTDGMTTDLWVDVGGAVVRSGLTGSLFFLIGLGFTVLINSSIGSIVGFLIYTFVVEVIIGSILPKLGAWLPMFNATVFTDGSDMLLFPGPFDSEVEPWVHHGYLTAGGILAAWGLVLLAGSFLRFQRRDVD